MSELRVDNIVDMGGSGAPQLRKGANVTGISTITQAVVGNTTINAGGINATGIITSSSNKFVGDLASGNITAGVMTATSSVVASNITINSGGVNASGIVSATSYQGSGANLTGIGLTIAPLAYNPDVSESNASLTGIGLTFNQRVFAGVGTVTLSLVSIGSTVAEVFGLGNATSTTYTVTVSNPGSGNKYYLDGNLSYSPTLYPGGIYTFDQSAASNSGHPLRFATAADAAGSTEYTTGVETNGTPGNSGAYTRITVAADAPDTLYYYCTNHSGMGSNVSIGANVQFNNDANPPNITITPKTNLTIGTKYAISYPSGAFIKNTGAGSSFVGTAYTFTARSYSYELWCWGTNTVGNLGQNNETKYSSPVQIPGTNWRRYVAAEYQAYGIKDDNTLWAWGRDLYGALGQNKANAYASSPVQIPGTTWSSTLGKFDSGSYEDCIAIKTDGTLWTWGRNTHGQLAQNNTTQRSSPVQVPGTDWNLCSMGANVSAAIKTNGTLWMWGNSVHGVLGQNQSPSGGNAGVSSPIQIPGTTWSNIDVSRTSMYATKTDGTLWSWGYNNWGYLGHNNTTPASSPIQIPGTTWSILPHPNGGSTRVSQSLMKTDGTLWVMGYNGSFGHLGQNNRTPYSSPKQVGTETTWSTHSHNYGFMGGIKTDGTLWNWGRNDNGNLGQNSVQSPAYQGLSSPVQVPGTTWHQYSSGGIPFAGAIKKI